MRVCRVRSEGGAVVPVPVLREGPSAERTLMWLSRSPVPIVPRTSLGISTAQTP
jgi:hypothetical protein